MFVGYLGTYIALSGEDIVQRHLCSWFDEERAEPLTAEELLERGYERQEVPFGCYVFYHKDKGYLSLACDMSVGHVDSIGKTEAFQDIDPSILPEPVEKRPLHEGIEKNIHKIWISQNHNNEIPSVFEENSKNINDLNENYSYRLWTEGGDNDIEKFILDNYGETVLEFYKNINPAYGAAKADFFRYLCIYALGGVYLDLKSTIVVPLDRIIRPTDRFLVSVWWHGAHRFDEIQHMPCGEYEQYHIICASGHPVIWRLIHQVMCLMRIYSPDIQGVGSTGTFTVTGPFVYSRMIETFGNEGPLRQFHSVSNGVEYSTFGDLGAHRPYMENTHYERVYSPLVGEPPEEDHLASDSDAGQRVWLMDILGQIISHSPNGGGHLMRVPFPDVLPLGFVYLSYPLRKSYISGWWDFYGNKLEDVPDLILEPEYDGSVTLRKKESNEYVAIDVRTTNVFYVDGKASWKHLLPLTYDMMQGMALLMTRGMAEIEFTGAGEEIGEPLKFPEPGGGDFHMGMLGDKKIDIKKSRSLLKKLGQLDLGETGTVSLPLFNSKETCKVRVTRLKPVIEEG